MTDAPSSGAAPLQQRRMRFGIGRQLYLGLGGAVLLTIVASLLAVLAFSVIDRLQHRIAEHTVPTRGVALQLAQQAAVLAGAAPKLVSVSDDTERQAVAAELGLEQDHLQDLMRQLAKLGEEQLKPTQALANRLADALGELDSSVQERLVLDLEVSAAADAAAEAQRDLAKQLAPLIDDALFYLATGFKTLDSLPAPPSVRAAEPEIARYRALTEIGAAANLLSGFLAQAAQTLDLELLQPLEDRFSAAAAEADRSMAALAGSDGAQDLGAGLASIVALGSGTGGIFDLRGRNLAELRHEQDLLRTSREVSASLGDKVRVIVAAADAEVDQAFGTSAAAIEWSRRGLIALNAVSVVGAVLIGWLYVGRGLLRRLTTLAGAMRQMAGGNLEVPVERRGNDEVTDMADALEVFRRNALEVQRLNLVEKLANQLSERNAELQKTLDELHRAQDQIVLQEKMASLGQLSAGIAHEIKNPLNFVNNFARLSGDLLSELKEELPAPGETVDEDASAEIAAIMEDLSGNLRKIDEHGKRADGIVRRMLEHSRSGGGERAPTDVNELVEQYLMLAYHGIRAQHPDFNLSIERRYDAALAPVPAVAQDLGRVFLNLIANACYALRERQVKAGPSFKPALSIATRAIEDRVEIAVRDNGPGIPQKHLEKLFTPFFTTKPPGEGTGLGLSISFDIVKQHGGTVRVDTAPDQFTEFTVSLPRAAPAAPPPPRSGGG